MRLPVHLVVFTIAYLVCFYSRRTKPLRSLAVRLGDAEDSWAMNDADGGREWLAYLQRAFGFVVMGIVPFLLLSIAESDLFGGFAPARTNESAIQAAEGSGSILGSLMHGISEAAELSGAVLPGGEGVVLWTILPIGLALAFTWVRSGARILLDFYPDVRKVEWPAKRVILNGLFWTLYLIGFEYVLRGYLLFPLVPELGIDGAVALNASLFALINIDGGPGKAFGAFLLGIIFCMVALATHSFVVPLIMHIIISVGRDMTAVTVSWEMRFVGGRKG